MTDKEIIRLLVRSSIAYAKTRSILQKEAESNPAVRTVFAEIPKITDIQDVIALEKLAGSNINVSTVNSLEDVKNNM